MIFLNDLPAQAAKNAVPRNKLCFTTGVRIIFRIGHK